MVSVVLPDFFKCHAYFFIRFRRLADLRTVRPVAGTWEPITSKL